MTPAAANIMRESVAMAIPTMATIPRPEDI